MGWKKRWLKKQKKRQVHIAEDQMQKTDAMLSVGKELSYNNAKLWQLALFSLNNFAVSNPIPLVPPVTIATLSSNIFISPFLKFSTLIIFIFI